MRLVPEENVGNGRPVTTTFNLKLGRECDCATHHSLLHSHRSGSSTVPAIAFNLNFYSCGMIIMIHDSHANTNKQGYGPGSY